MTFTRRESLALLGGTALTAATAPMASAATVHEVLMLNKHPDDPKQRQVFVPDLIRAKVGDTIRFVAADKSHNSEVDKKMMPDGGTKWKGKVSSDVEVVMEVEGAYGFKCAPHASTGMVGLILVGDVSGNYEDVKSLRQRGKAKQRYADIFKRADAMLAAES